MNIKFKYKNNKITLYLLIFLWLIINIIIFPNNCIIAAKKGLLTWFNIIVPSLFPFFVITDLLINFGFIELIGALLEPLMKPLFNVSGKGAFPLIMSFTSGYPVGVKLVSSLRINNMVSKVEAQRLLAFCSTSGPMFMIGAVATGMFNTQSITPLIVIPHYLGAITVGVIFRFYKKQATPKYNISHMDNVRNLYTKTISSENKSLGKLLSKSIQNSLYSISIIGGFMIFYSVVAEILKISWLINVLNTFIAHITPLNENTQIIKAILSGIFEITIGCAEVTSLSDLSILNKILVVNFLIGWSGLSIISQALSFVQHTDLDGRIYVFSKLLHGCTSCLYSYVIYKLRFKNIILPSFNQINNLVYSISITTWSKIAIFSIVIMFCSIILLIIYGLIINTISKIYKNN